MEAQLVMLGAEGRGALVCAMDPATLHDHDDLFPRVAEGRPHWVDRLAQLLRIKVGDDCREDLGGAVLSRAQHPAQHAVGAPAPERYRPHAGRVRDSARVLWLWLRGWVRRR